MGGERWDRKQGYKREGTTTKGEERKDGNGELRVVAKNTFSNMASVSHTGF